MSIFLSPNSSIICREILKDHQNPLKSCGLIVNIDSGTKSGWNTRSKRDFRANSASSSWLDFSRPESVEMQSIADCDQLDKILTEAQLVSQPVIIDWMASWCRKCIYLKPKLEKLAAEYDTKLNMYYVDVNKVSKELVKRGNISKMPTIQLWKDGEMKAEVIGGHKAWLVVEEVREMIQKFV